MTISERIGLRLFPRAVVINRTHWESFSPVERLRIRVASYAKLRAFVSPNRFSPRGLMYVIDRRLQYFTYEGWTI